MIRRDPVTRSKLAELKAQIRKIEQPHLKAQRQAMKEARAQRVRAIGTPAQGQRQPRVKEPLYLAWIRRQPCIVCVARGGTINRPSQAAHIRAGYPVDGWRPTGMQQKPDDRRTAPLCADHHLDAPDAQHRAGERGWWEALGIYPPALCAALSAAYDANQDAAPVLASFARTALRSTENIPSRGGGRHE